MQDEGHKERERERESVENPTFNPGLVIRLGRCKYSSKAKRHKFYCTDLSSSLKISQQKTNHFNGSVHQNMHKNSFVFKKNRLLGGYSIGANKLCVLHV